MSALITDWCPHCGQWNPEESSRCDRCRRCLGRLGPAYVLNAKKPVALLVLLASLGTGAALWDIRHSHPVTPAGPADARSYAFDEQVHQQVNVLTSAEREKPGAL